MTAYAVTQEQGRKSGNMTPYLSVNAAIYTLGRNWEADDEWLFEESHDQGNISTKSSHDVPLPDESRFNLANV